MLRFVVTKNGVFVGKPFGSREEADEVAELEKLGEPSADVRVQPVLTVSEELDEAEGQALVEAILEGEDFSDLPPEHRGPTVPPDEEEDDAAPGAAFGQDYAGKKPTEHGKKGKAAPAKGSSFFVRHPSYVPEADEVLEELWAQDAIAVHLPSGGVGEGSEAPEFANPQKSSWDKLAAKRLADLAEGGGYAWVETRVRPGLAKVGRVVPQRPRDVRASWTAPKHPQHAGEPGGGEVLLRTVQLEDVREISADEAATLRAERPLAGTVRRWTVAGSRLEALVEGVPLGRTWGNLTPLQQRATCAEFLRSNRSKSEYPRLKFLLAPDGARLENVDVLGMQEDGTEILARVTSFEKGSPRARSEAWALKKRHYRPGRRLVLFCSFPGSADPARSAPSLFPLEPFQGFPQDGVSFVPVEEVLEWVKTQAVYADKLFSL